MKEKNYHTLHYMTHSDSSLHNNAIWRAAVMGIFALMMSSCHDAWNEHYGTTGKQSSSSNTLWDEIASRPELNEFRSLLEQTGCRDALDSDQMFTVFAPKGSIRSTAGSTEALINEVVYNHVARFPLSASNRLGVARSVRMLNGKVGTFEANDDRYTFAGKALTESNIICRNGVLHVIEGQIPFFCNVWEYMDQDTTYSCIRDYLYSFNAIRLDEDASVAGAVVDGQITYVDSVVINTNEMFYRIGQLNSEDSTYWMVLPTNRAWRDAYERVSSYYCYSAKNPQRDSLQNHYTQQAMVSDLVFSRSMQLMPADALISTCCHTFPNPLQTLLPEYVGFDHGIECSNGTVFPVDTLRHAPWLSWHSPIKVEAENQRGREYTLCELYKRSLSASSPYFELVSDASYIETVPTTSSANPSIIFTIPDVLSASYDIKAVFLPQTLGIDKSNYGRPNKLICNLTTVDANGKSITDKSEVLCTDPTAIDTVTLFKGYTFEACNYDEESVTTKLKIISQVTSRERADYSRTLLIDCILFEPAK